MDIKDWDIPLTKLRHACSINFLVNKRLKEMAKKDHSNEPAAPKKTAPPGA